VSKKALTYSPTNGLEIAIIGLIGRFPGASDVDRFWQNLKEGVEATTTFSGEELLASGVHPDLLANAQYVRSGAILEDIDLFDARFFDYSPREAELMDPQQRIFLECAWEALENAGYAPEIFKGEIGVYAGVNLDTYIFNLLPDLNTTESMDNLQVLTGNDKDYLTTRISYKLNLKGPSVAVQTACSTSLVAVHLACRGLLSGDCDMALAGGISLRIPQKSGYLYHEGGIYSPDGHCRAFDAEAKGATFGSGVGIVVLKRLEDALAAGDTVHAVIKGSAINNDGSGKVGYTAPSVTGQARVIRSALLSAEIEAETLSYIEAHGTGTPLGDPIEIMALTEAFHAQKKGFCAIGSVKTNIGHLDAAAGVAGLIKTVQALKAKQIPASLHFERPNPKIDFAATPFYVNTSLREWQTSELSRRAGVSSFGIGGTNAHVILEEAPPTLPEARPARDLQLLVLSAKTSTALEMATERLACYLAAKDQVDLADVAYTLQVGRKRFPYRRVVQCQNREQALALLTQPEGSDVLTSFQEENERPVVFLFPGQGSQYRGMAQELYASEDVFRSTVDQCCRLLEKPLGLDLRTYLFPQAGQAGTSGEAADQTAFAQPALFVVEYALAQLWLSWGIKPQALLGHSIGEYVAACLAGVFSLEEGLSLVAARGRLIQQLPGGQMLAVALPLADLKQIMPAGLDIAAVNSSSWCVVSGRPEGVQAFQTQLQAEGSDTRLLHTSHAFHSEMMEPILPAFLEQVRRINLKAPRIPFISNLTGTWATASAVTDAGYWVSHLRQTVQFAEGLKTLLDHFSPFFLEVGPGRTLSTFVRQQLRERPSSDVSVSSSLPHSQDAGSDSSMLLSALGSLWLAGATIDWMGFAKKEQRRRIPLPTYPFERERFWIEGIPASSNPIRPEARKGLVSPQVQREYFYLPSWKRTLPFRFSSYDEPRSPCLIFKDHTGFSGALKDALQKTGLVNESIEVEAGDCFRKNNSWSYQINPQRAEDYISLLQELKADEKFPTRIIHLWSLTGTRTHARATQEELEYAGFYSLLFLSQALGHLKVSSPLAIEVIADYCQQVLGEEQIQPEKALLLGPCKVIPQEYPRLSCRTIDIHVPQRESRSEELLLERLVAEFAQKSTDNVIAFRGRDRYVQELVETNLEQAAFPTSSLRQQGVYLLTGGLGGVGLALAEYLARTCQARLALVSRRALPPREEWSTWLSQDQEGTLKEQIQAIQHLESLGSEVLLIKADVTIYQETERALQQALEHFQEIHGVIHAAGLPGTGLIQFKTPAQAAEVLGAKVRGTRNLEQALAGMPLDFFLLCSSTLALTGSIGQVDYCAANAFLDAFASYNTYANDVFTLSINWDGWDQVGMNKQESQLHASLLDRCLEKTDTHAVYATYLSPQKHWVLAEHQVLGKPALPGTAYVQMVKEAFWDYCAIQAIDIENLLFLNPLWVEPDGTREVYTVFKKEDARFRFRILSRDPSQAELTQFYEHASGIVSISPEEPRRQLNLQEITGNCQAKGTGFQEETEQKNDSLVTWGPRWRSIQKVFVDQDEVLAYLELPAEFHHDLEQMDLHPALLDVATGFASIATGRPAYLPLMYGHLHLLKPLPANLWSYAKRREGVLSEKETLAFDITLVDETGYEVASIENFTLVNEEMLQVEGAGEQERKAEVSESMLTQLLLKQASAALSPARAVQAFEQIMQGVTVPQIVVAARDLRVLDDSRSPIATSAANLETDTPIHTQSQHARPRLSTTYVAPRNPLEEDVTGIWQEALGIDQVGIHDDFFDLGGHSLLALQIVDRLRKAFNLALPLAELVKAPTVAQITQAIREQLAEQEEQEKSELLDLLTSLSDEEVEIELERRGML